MSSWIGSARTNYFAVKDRAGLEKALAPFEIAIEAHPEDLAFVSLRTDDEWGGMPSIAYIESEEDEDGMVEDQEVFFDPVEHICPFMREDQLLVIVESGAERLRYITGVANAYSADGRHVGISIDDIYEKAVKELGADPKCFARATYQDLPETR